MKRNLKTLTTLMGILIIILILVFGTVFIILKFRFECGDKVCELHELTTCPEDCIKECNELIEKSNLSILDNSKLDNFIRRECSITWDKEYTDLRIENGISDRYVLRTKTYNYDDLKLQEIINKFQEREFENIEEVIRVVGDYVYFNINYRDYLSYKDCIITPASEVIARKYGICTTMTNTNIALLRGLGIASRSVVGCVKTEDYDCTPLRYEGITTQSIFEKRRLPKVSEIRIEDGIAITGGGLHGWVEVWLPERGWVILESTTGYMVNKDCQSYNIFKISPSLIDFCGLNKINSGEFIRTCEKF